MTVAAYLPNRLEPMLRFNS